MANRFYVPDAVDFSGVQLYQPNFEMLNTVLANKQERWDLVSEAARKMPQAFGTVDQQRRAEKIQENEQRMLDLGDTFKMDISKGDQALDDFLMDIRGDFSPGGEAYQLQQNYDAAKAYTSRVNDLFDDGVITNAQKVQWLTNTSAARFQGTQFDPSTGGFNSFSGIDPAADIDMMSEFNEMFKGYERTALMRPVVDRATGEVKLDANGEPQMTRYEDWRKVAGGYRHFKTGEFVPYDEIFEGAIKYAETDPRFQSYLNQEAEMNGYTNTGVNIDPRDGVSTLTDSEAYKLHRIVSAADPIAKKYSYTRFEDIIREDWQSKIAARGAQDRRTAAYVHGLEQPVFDNVTSITEGATMTAPSGANIDQVKDTIGATQQRMEDMLQSLYKNSGFRQALIDYNEELLANDPSAEVVNENDKGQLGLLMRAGAIKRPAGYGPDLWEAAINTFIDGQDDMNIAKQRLDEAEAAARKNLTTDEIRSLDNYDAVQIPRVRKMLGSAPREVRSVISEDNMMAMLSGESIIKEGRTYYVENGNIKYTTGERFSANAADGSAGSGMVEFSLYNSSDILEMEREANKVSRIERKRRDDMNAILGKETPVSFEVSTDLLPTNTDGEAKQAASDALTAFGKANGVYMNDFAHSSWTPAEKKVEISDMEGAQLELRGVPQLTDRHDPNTGERLIYFSYDITGDTDDIKALSPSERRVNYLVPASAVETDLMSLEDYTEDADIQRDWERVNNSNVEEPVTMLKYGEDITWQATDQGGMRVSYPNADGDMVETLVSDNLGKAFMKDQAKLNNRLLAAGVDRQQYALFDELVARPYERNNWDADTTVAAALKAGFNARQAGILLLNDPYAFQYDYAKRGQQNPQQIRNN